MSDPAYRGDEIVVVGCGAVLPQATGVAELWSRLLAGESLVRPIPRRRWPVENHLVPLAERTRSGDKLYSSHAGWIDEEVIARLRRELSLPDADRLQVMTLAASVEAMAGVSMASIAPARAAIFFGCMDQDESIGNLRFMREEGSFLRAALSDVPAAERDALLAAITRHFEPQPTSEKKWRATVLPSSVLALVRERLAMRGEAALVDAACASSLAALDQALRALRAGEVDFALAGGIESNLGPESFALFSRINALAGTHCRPFDRRGDGLNQGEGAAVLALKRLADARAAGDSIRGVLRACGSSSDGHSASLFEPTSDGQVLALERAYVGLDRRAVVYLECHGTGTRVGDETEVASATRFFGSHPLTMGTSKALFGHTKGAAGAVGLLKCLLVLEHRTVPPLPYCTAPLAGVGDTLKIATQPEPLPEQEWPTYLGISSFGFGGVNYHLVLERYAPDAVLSPAAPAAPALESEPLVLCGQATVMCAAVDPAALSVRFHLPPRSLRQIDRLQFAALAATDALWRELMLDEIGLDQDRICVIAASALGIDRAVALAMRVRYHELATALPAVAPARLAALMQAGAHNPEVTEDTGPGILNNVIAGRVAQAFNLRGPSFNLDADFASFPVALRRGARLVNGGFQCALVLRAHEQLAPDGHAVVRDGVTCHLVTTRAEALRQGLPLRAVISAEAEPSAIFA